ncbi:MAG: UpxY family transcription antiterminator [Candidatus Cyclonatronum sp.]|uniref:UpxY family transcription antiterminator n=1 Tax=Cyclonatronum sp. TaxID=3024185 RepID=UPI0025C20EA6|nr:UpxY family transcription antiterminator [Cyclonatronum sp.]MCH8488292.1 UpxY family transcription antiterminator [Cyclonatronum sp.]
MSTTEQANAPQNKQTADQARENTADAKPAQTDSPDEREAASETEQRKGHEAPAPKLIPDSEGREPDEETGELSRKPDLSSHADSAPSAMLRQSGIVLREGSKIPKVEHVLREIAARNEKPKWYALKTKPRAEKKTDARLRQAGYNSYCPLKKELRVWSDRKKWIESPMFNGYILVNTVTSDFSRILADEGAVHFVKFSGRVSAVPDEQVEFIRKIVENKMRYEVTEIKFEKGDKVEITDGPFKGHEAVWMKQKTKFNVSIEIKQLSTVLSVEIPAAFLRKAETDGEEASGAQPVQKAKA